MQLRSFASMTAFILVGACGSAGPIQEGSGPSGGGEALSWPRPESEADGFVLPVAFPDGTTVEIVYDRDLPLHELRIQPEGDYRSGRPDMVLPDGWATAVHFPQERNSTPPPGRRPIKEHADARGRPVYEWEAVPEVTGDDLFLHFGPWTVNATAYDDKPPTEERVRIIAENVRGFETAAGFLSLRARPPVEMWTTGPGPPATQLLFGGYTITDTCVEIGGARREQHRGGTLQVIEDGADVGVDFVAWCDPTGGFMIGMNEPRRDALEVVEAIQFRNPGNVFEEIEQSEETSGAPDELPYDGDSPGLFYPAERQEGDSYVMPLTFVDGTTAELTFPPGLGIEDYGAQIFTAGGLGGIDRTIDFRYGAPTVFAHEGPLASYPGRDGTVEEWRGSDELEAGFTYLIYRFGDWYVAVRTAQDHLNEDDKRSWAALLSGTQSQHGWLELNAERPLELQRTGGHEGPQIVIYADYGRNWFVLIPRNCEAPVAGPDGELRTTEDGTVVRLSRIGRDRFAEWCQEGKMTVSLQNSTDDFVDAAIEGVRVRNIRYPGGG